MASKFESSIGGLLVEAQIKYAICIEHGNEPDGANDIVIAATAAADDEIDD